MIFEQLIEKNNFTNTEVRIADFFIENKTSLEISSMSIKDIAQKTYTSHSSIIRLTKKLGFSGYKEFRAALVKELYFNSNQKEMINPDFPFYYSDSDADIVKQLAHLSIDSINQLSTCIDVSLLSKTADAINTAERLFIFATGDSQIRAKSFQNRLKKINIYPILADDLGEGNWNLLNVTSKDIIIIISYSGNDKSYDYYVDYANKNKIKTVLLSGHMSKTINKLVTFDISISSNESYDLKISTFLSQISFEYILDTLFAMIFSRDYLKNVQLLKQHQNQINQLKNIQGE